MFALHLLGAGFSRPAGLPLGCELFSTVIKRIKEREAVLYKNVVKPDIREFQLFQKRTKGIEVSEATIDLE